MSAVPGGGMTERYLQAFRAVYEATGSYEAASAAADAWLERTDAAIARRAAWVRAGKTGN